MTYTIIYIDLQTQYIPYYAEFCKQKILSYIDLQIVKYHTRFIDSLNRRRTIMYNYLPN